MSGREAWQGFRDLVKPKWSEAFIAAVEQATGSREFTYVLAVTVIIGNRKLWEEHAPFTSALAGNPIRMLELTEILGYLRSVSTTTVAASDIGRVLQLMQAAERGKKALLDVVEQQNND